MSYRAANHKSKLKRGVHFTPKLQAAYDNYGPDYFAVEFYPTQERLLDAENRRIAERRAQGICLNEQGTPEWRQRVSDRVKRQHAEGRIGYDLETVKRRKPWDRTQPHGLKGRKQTPEHIAAAVAARKRRK